MNIYREEYVKIIEDCIGKLISDSEFDSEFNYLKDKLGVISEDIDKKITLDTDFVNFIYECCLINVNLPDDSEIKASFSKMFEVHYSEWLEEFLRGLITDTDRRIERTENRFKAYYQHFVEDDSNGASYITYESDVSGKVVSDT